MYAAHSPCRRGAIAQPSGRVVYSARTRGGTPRSTVYRSENMKRWHTILIGLIISAGFLYLSLRQADFGQIIGAFRTARYGYVVLGLAGVVVTVLVRGLRWSVLTQ